ncbi:MAG: hypothetical protein JXQ73_13990 [Phycisphaerae bacterium]|nr:hypothetical protein [Phycisphaerae bacterium]
MSETVGRSERPASITVISVLGIIGALAAIVTAFLPIARQIGSWYPSYLGLAAVVGLVCMVGLWMMKKWAAYTYAALVVFNQAVLLAMGAWSIWSLLLPAIVIFFALKHVSKMT